MNRDTAFPYILADAFLAWWREMGQPEIRSAFQYWADRESLGVRRRSSVWRRVSEAKRPSQAA